MNNALQKFLLGCAISAASLLTACGGGGSGSSDISTPVPPQGTMHVSLTDAPACGFDAVNITVSKVRVHQSASANENDAGWADITLNPPRKINLLNLVNGTLEDLGQTPLAVGHYTQLRLVLVANSTATPLANSVVVTGGVETAIDTPSAVQSGIKLTNEFDVAANTLVDFTLDFDACKSIVTRGNGSFSLKPVIRIVPMVVSGGITGYINPSLSASKPAVTAQLNGVIVKSTVPDPVTGAFTLGPIVQSTTTSTYTVVITADGRATYVVSGVPVTAKANTVLSTSASPINLAVSTMSTVSGTILPLAAQGTARATQSFAAGPTVTIKYQSADLITAVYSLSLPTAAPMLGVYGTGTLPIVATAQTALAGKYTAEASATGYVTQSAAVDITIANVVKNFVLVQ